MRNALLALLGAAVLGALAWWWPRADDTPPSAAETTVIASPPPAEAPSTASPPAASAAPQPTAANAVELTRRAGERLNADPAAALSDIEQADRLDDSPDPARRALEISALVRLGRVGHARALADRFYRAFPGNPEIPQIERLTGYHPRPYGPP